MNQRTVQSTAEVRGIGLHTGVEIVATIKPAPVGSGVAFIRTDLEGSPRIPISIDAVNSRGRRTSLGVGDAEIHTLEHLLAAFAGLGIDNAEVELTGPELPGGDGSARVFVEALDDAGIVEQPKSTRRIIELSEPIYVRDERTGATIVALPDPTGPHVQYTLDYTAAPAALGAQHLELSIDEDTFRRELAGARTFCLASEIEQLREAGFGKGSTYQNTLVVGDDGVIDNEVRWPDEFVRHKVLDLVGDLFLAGGPIRARFIASRTGHRQNVDLVRAILRQESERRRKEAAAKGQLDIREIMRILPHRYPFLLIDRVTELEGFKRAVGIKNVTINELYFQGHWPGQPIMPGVLQIEAMAQLAGVLLLRKLEHTGKLAVLLSIERVKLRRAVVPGDTLRLEAEAINVKPRTGRVQCRGWVGDRMVCEARINFMLTDA